MSEERRGASSRGEAKREGIREAARVLFLERGFVGASTDAIAGEAGVSKETLYRHFASKEELLADVLGSLIADVSKRGMPGGAIPVGDRDELREALLAFGRAFVSNLMQPEYIALARVIVAETPRLPRLGDLFRSTVPERAIGGAEALLDTARENGVIRAVDTNAAARMLVGPLLTYVILDGLFRGDTPPIRPPDEKIQTIVDLHLEALM